MISDASHIVIDSDWRSARWQVPISSAPEIVAGGIALHGSHGNDRFYLPGLWCLHLYTYTATLRIGTQWFPIRPGYVGITPPDTGIEYVYNGLSRHLYVHFRLPETALASAGSPLVSIPVMYDLGADFADVYRRLAQVICVPNRLANHSSARVWDALCDVAERGAMAQNGPGVSIHPAVKIAVAEIETRLADSIRVAELAERVGVSYGYLSKVFRVELGSSVVEYIRNRRMDQAAHMLTHTSLSIKAIAASVGIPDIHLFNKTVRRTYGVPPRALRGERAGSVRTPSRHEKAPESV